MGTRVSDVRVSIGSSSGGGGGSGSGDVTGPASSTDNAIARFDGLTGKVLQNSTITLTDGGGLESVALIDFAIGVAPPHTEGRIFYDNVERTLAIYNDDANVTHQLGQEILVRVYNGSGALIPDGSAVYQSGVQIEAGVGRPEITLAQADAEATSRVIGIVTADIGINSYGWVTMEGFVNGINLTAYSFGDLLYLSETTPGGFRVGPPPVGNAVVELGYVVEATAGGRLLVSVRVESVQNDSEVPLSGQIGTPTVQSVADRMDREGSPGIFNGGALITDDGDGTVTVATMRGIIRATNDDTAPLLSFDIGSSTPITPTDDDITYLYVEYNAGSPQVVGTTVERVDYNTNILLGTVHRDGTLLNITNRQPIITALARDLHRALIDTEGLRHAEGADLAETGTRNISVSAGEFWLGLDPIATSAFDSSAADSFSRFYRDGLGGWTRVASQTQIDNTSWDDGSGTLATLTTNRYGVRWVYLDVDSEVSIVIGRGDYTLAQALSAEPPTSVPPHMQENHASLAGKIIIQESRSTFHSLESAYIVQFAAVASLSQASVTTFDTLQGFTTGNRYDADANGYGGVATGFFFGALVEVLRLDSGGGQSIWGNVNFGVDGWGLGIESNGRFQAYFIDTGGAQVASTAGAADTLNDPGGAFMSSKLALLLGQVVQNGANNDVYLWINGQRIPVGTGAAAYAPRTGIAQIGAGAFGNVAEDTGISGVMYYEGTLTDTEILDWYHACYDAHDIVADGIGMTIFSVKRGTPASVWTESDGSGPDFSRVGSLSLVTRKEGLWA